MNLRHTKTFSLVLLLFAQAAQGAEDRGVFRTSNTYGGKYYEIVVMQSALDKTPIWSDDQPNPPLAARTAFSNAKAQLAKLLPEAADWPPEKLSLMQIGGKDRWIYLVDLKTPPPAGGSAGFVPPFRVVVLMDGSIVPPKHIEDPRQIKDITMIQFTAAPVSQVLHVYKELVGADLEIDTAVPQAAQVSVPNQFVGKDEATRIVERALRQQAGVVVTRLDANRVAVKFDETVKTKSEK